MPRAYWISSLLTPAATIGHTMASRETVKSTTTGRSSISMARVICLMFPTERMRVRRSRMEAKGQPTSCFLTVAMAALTVALASSEFG